MQKRFIYKNFNITFVENDNYFKDLKKIRRKKCMHENVLNSNKFNNCFFLQLK